MCDRLPPSSRETDVGRLDTEIFDEVQDLQLVLDVRVNDGRRL